MSKQAVQFEEGDALIDNSGWRLEVANGSWQWYEYGTHDTMEPTVGELAILGALTEIVKPLRTHKISDLIYREDWMCRADNDEWEPCLDTYYTRDLFRSWGWPIPAHMEEK